MLAYLLLFYICLVGKDEDRDVLNCKLFDLLHPNLNGVKWIFIHYAIHEEYSHGWSIIWRSKCSEPFLPSSIPNLYENILIVDIDDPLSIVKTNSILLFLIELLVAKALNNRCFADIAISNNNIFNYFVIFLIDHRFCKFNI